MLRLSLAELDILYRNVLAQSPTISSLLLQESMDAASTFLVTGLFLPGKKILVVRCFHGGFNCVLKQVIEKTQLESRTRKGIQILFCAGRGFFCYTYSTHSTWQEARVLCFYKELIHSKARIRAKQPALADSNVPTMML